MYPSRPSLLHGESRRGVWSHASRHARLSVRTYGVPACLRLCVGAQTPTVHVHNKSRLFVLSSKLFCGLVPVHDLSRLSPHFRPTRRPIEGFFATKIFPVRCVGQRDVCARCVEQQQQQSRRRPRAAVRWRRGRSIGRRRRSGAEGSAGVTKSKARVRLLSCPQQASRSHNQRSHSVQFHASSLITSGCQLRLQGGQHPSHVSHPFPNSACRQP